MKRNRLRRAALLGLSTAFLVTACGTVTEIAVTTTWEAILTSPGIGGPNGTVAVVSQNDRVVANISLGGALPGQEYAWRLGNGSCDSPGDILGGRALYPALAISDTGEASAAAVIAGSLDPDGTYYAAVQDSPEDGAVVLACGLLERQ